MERLYRSLTGTIAGVFDMTTTSVKALHNLADGACERTIVVREKAIASACVSSLRGRQTVALELKELRDFENENPNLLAQADIILGNYIAQRAYQDRPHPSPARPAANTSKPSKAAKSKK